MDPKEFEEVMNSLHRAPREELALFDDPAVLAYVLAALTNDQKMDFIIVKNSIKFGGLNEYVADFAKKTRETISKMPEGVGKEAAKTGQRLLVERLLTKEGLSEESRQALQDLLGRVLAAAAAGGKRRKSTRRRRGRSTRRVR